MEVLGERVLITYFRIFSQCVPRGPARRSGVLSSIMGRTFFSPLLFFFFFLFRFLFSYCDFIWFLYTA